MNPHEDELDLEHEVVSRRSKQGVEALATWVGGDPGRFEKAWIVMQHGPRRASECAAWLVDKCLLRWPALLEPYQAVAHDMLFVGYHPAVHRCLVKYLARIPIDEGLQMPLFELCLRLVTDSSKQLAIRCNAMSVACNIAVPEPDLREVLAEILEPYLRDASPAVRSRSRMVLAKLERVR